MSNKSSNKNIYKNTPEVTWVDTTIEKDGVKKQVFIPDSKSAYGDKKSVKQLTEDFVGKHSDNESAIKAGEDAQRQLEETDFNSVIEKIRQDKWKSQNKMMDMMVHTDKVTGETTGATITFMTTTGDGLSYPRNVHLDQTQIQKVIERTDGAK
tara:strand:+ start:429 stop:887 length:459 start_codon:yes stop_codon:yes gene_type:complete